MPKVKKFSELSRRQQNRRLKEIQALENFEKQNISEASHVEKEKCHNLYDHKDFHKICNAPKIVNEPKITDFITNHNILEQENFLHDESSTTIHTSTSCNEMYCIPISNTVMSLQDKLILWVNEHKVEHNTLTCLLKILKNEGHNDLPSDGRTLMKTPRCTTIHETSSGQYYHYGLKNGINDVLCHQNESIVANPIIINVNIDGLPVAKSSKSQLWPILAQIVLADSTTPFIVGAYHGFNKPNSNDFLQHFITEYQQLNTIGFTFQNNIYQVQIRAIICDTPARSLVTCTKAHNGYFGCSKCIVEGDYENHRMLFLDNNCPLRTDDTFNLRKNPEHHTGISPFEQIHVPMVTTFPLDYMHLVCLGQMKKLLHLWLKGPNRHGARLSGEQIRNMTSDMLHLKQYVCSEFVRMPSSFDEVGKWKATEFRIFLLYLAPVLLPKFLPSIYMKHFLAFHCAIRLLCHPQDYLERNKYAKELLHYFVQCYPVLYGKENMIFTVHSLIHLSDDAKKFGCLDTFSTFPFENHLHSVKKILRKHEKPLQQIHRRIIEKNTAKKVTMNTNPVKFPILISHNNKKIPFQCSESYDTLQMPDFKLSCEKIANRFCFLKNNKIVLIHYIGLQNGNAVIIGQEYINYYNYTLYPCNSRHMNVFMVDDNLSELKYFAVTEIARKAVALPWEGGKRLCVFPLLHSDILEGIHIDIYI